MGVAFSALSELSPLYAAQSTSHDLSVYVFNACESSCNCCDCLRVAFKTYETHDDSDNDNNSVSITWNS